MTNREESREENQTVKIEEAKHFIKKSAWIVILATIILIGSFIYYLHVDQVLDQTEEIINDCLSWSYQTTSTEFTLNNSIHYLDGTIEYNDCFFGDVEGLNDMTVQIVGDYSSYTNGQKYEARIYTLEFNELEYSKKIKALFPYNIQRAFREKELEKLKSKSENIFQGIIQYAVIEGCDFDIKSMQDTAMEEYINQSLNKYDGRWSLFKDNYNTLAIVAICVLFIFSWLLCIACIWF